MNYFAAILYRILTQDLNKKISQIHYNAVSLPSEVRFGDGSYITYLYDPSGRKLRADYHINQMGTLNPIVGPLPMSVGAGTVDTGEASIASIPIIGPNPPIIPIRLTHTYTEYFGNHIFENGLLTMTLIPGGYISYEGGCPTAPSYHFYLCDHEGNNRVVTDINGNIEQVNDYTPFGVLMKNDFSASSTQPYKYNGKELDRMHGLDLYEYGARMYNAPLGRWHVMDPLCEKYYSVSPYVYCANNPVKFVNPDGKDVWLFATKLPGVHVPKATHTFIVVTGENGKIMRYAAYGPRNGWPMGGDKLMEIPYPQDQRVYEDYFNGICNENLRGKPQKVNVPKGMTPNEFDKKVIQTINSFGDKDGITYSLFGGGIDDTSGNCNTSSSTILIKSGVDENEMKSLESNIQGINTGFKTTNPKPWTKEEQEKALKRKELIDQCNILQKPL